MDDGTTFFPASDRWTFERLIAPLSPPEFRQILARREVVRLPNRGADTFSTLFGWQGLYDLIAEQRGDIPSLQVTRDGTRIPRAFYQTNGRTDCSKVQRLVDAGHSVMIRNLADHAPAIKLLADDIRAKVNESIRVAVVTTKGQGGAFPLHFDPVDVLAVQLEGSKRWCIYDQPTVNPVWGMGREPGQAAGTVVHDVSLVAGDVLFVPAGHSHRCYNLGERSSHLSFLFLPPCAQAILQALAHDLVSEPQWRRPFGRADGPEAENAAEHVKSALLDHIRSIPAEDLVKRVVDSDVASADY